MATDDLAPPYLSTTSAIAVLAIENKQVVIFHWESFQFRVPSYCSQIMKYILMLQKINPDAQWLKKEYCNMIYDGK